MVSRRTWFIRTLSAGLITLTAVPAGAVDTGGCGAAADPKLKGSALSEKLAKCNGVLKPSGAADGDIIIPAPKIDDPSIVHPKDLHKNKGVAK